MTIDEFSQSLIERAIAELDEGKNKEGKEQGADGKACWKGYKYAGTENGKDKCVKSEEWEKEEKGEKKHKEGKEEEKKEKMKEARDMPGNQEKIDANKNGKVDAHDFALLRAKKGKKSMKEMWEKAAEIAEGKKVEIEIMPQVDTPNDPEPTGKKAKKELKKEEVEQLEEKKLSKKETEKKEKFVKGMKKKYSSFKSRYGDRAKEVMYATATKMGKKAA